MSDGTSNTPRPLNRRNVLARSSRFGPNMTPMVDVTLVILIFFMASATIAGPEWFLKSHIPEETPDSNATGFGLPIPLLDAQLYVDGQRVMVRGIGDDPRTLESFIEQIKAMGSEQGKGLVLRIRASDEVPYESVVALQDAGASVEMRVALR